MGEEDDLIWIKHYCSDQIILLVGEGDFSFSASLAKSFRSAVNMVATSLDNKEDVIAKYSHCKKNLEMLMELGCKILHEVDVHTMTQHPFLSTKKFDRIVFNFPHAGYHYKWEHYQSQIDLHQEVVRGFFKSARDMLRENGEIHVTHKTAHPFNKWEVDKLGEELGLLLVDEVKFSKLDFPGYNNKRGDGPKTNRTFCIGSSSTFVFHKKEENDHEGDKDEDIHQEQVVQEDEDQEMYPYEEEGDDDEEFYSFEEDDEIYSYEEGDNGKEEEEEEDDNDEEEDEEGCDDKEEDDNDEEDGDREEYIDEKEDYPELLDEYIEGTAWS